MIKKRQIDWWTREHTDLFMDLLRIYIGVALFLKGLYFMNNADVLATMISSSSVNWFVPTAIAHYVIFAHLCGGIFMTMGFLTRLAVMAQTPVLLGAVLFVNLPGLGELASASQLEYSALMLFALSLFSVRGAGHYSFDEALFKRDKHWHEHQDLERIEN